MREERSTGGRQVQGFELEEFELEEAARGGWQSTSTGSGSSSSSSGAKKPKTEVADPIAAAAAAMQRDGWSASRIKAMSKGEMNNEIVKYLGVWFKSQDGKSFRPYEY